MGTIVVNPDVDLILPVVFGASLQSMGAQLGFNKSPTTYNLTLVEDLAKGQEFTLKSLSNNGIFSMQNLQIGTIDEWVLVESWDENQIDIGGSGVFKVKLSDTKLVLDAITIAVGFPVGSLSDFGTVITANSTSFATIKQRVEAKTFDFHNNRFKIELGVINNPRNMPTATEFLGLGGDASTEVLVVTRPPVTVRSELSTQEYLDFLRTHRETGTVLIDDTLSLDATDQELLTLNLGETPPPLPNTETVVLSDYISSTAMFNQNDWYVTTRKENNIFIITIKYIERSIQIADQIGIDVSDITDAHEGNIQKQNTGFEGNPDSNKRRIIFGARTQRIESFDSDSASPFWGFDPVTNEPYSDPSSALGADIDFKALNLVLDTEINEARTLNKRMNGRGHSREGWLILKAFAERFFGRQFFVTLPANVRARNSGWSGADTNIILGNLGRGANDDLGVVIQNKFQTSDGRWRAFIKVPDIDSRQKWTSTVLTSNTAVILSESIIYMPCTISHRNNIAIIKLDSTLTTKQQKTFVEPFEFQQRRAIALGGVWIPVEDTISRYGPWSNSANNDAGTFSFSGKTEIVVDSSLAPWSFNHKNLNNSEGIALMNKLANNDISQAVPHTPVVNTIDITVVDLPKFNMGTIIKSGSAISMINLNIGKEITTRYTAKTFLQNKFEKLKRDFDNSQLRTRESIIQQTKEFKQLMEEKEEEALSGELAENELIIKQNKPDPDILSWQNERPKGGIGIVIAKRGGPFYDVQRLDKVIPLEPFDEPLFKGAMVPIEWTNIRNIAEDDDSPGYLLEGMRVQVTMYDTGEEITGTGFDIPGAKISMEDRFAGATDAIVDTDGLTKKIPIMNETPPVFAVPVPPTT